MKRSRFTEEQLIGMLKEHEAGTKTAEICRKHGISEATFYNYKAVWMRDLLGMSDDLEGIGQSMWIRRPLNDQAASLLEGSQQAVIVTMVPSGARPSCCAEPGPSESLPQVFSASSRGLLVFTYGS